MHKAFSCTKKERAAQKNEDRGSRFKNWVSRYGFFILTPEEDEEIDQAPEQYRPLMMADKATPRLQPIWSFYMALCFTLQQGENEFLTADDAYWLGIIDEVIGEKDLYPQRLMIETVPDEEDTETSEEDNASEAGSANPAQPLN